MRNHKSFVLLIIFLHLNGLAFAAISQTWLKRSNGILEGKVHCLFVSPDESFVLAGTDKAIYRANKSDNQFLPVLQNHGSNPTINQIYQNPRAPSSLYSATNSGVFVSTDKGKTWKNIFSPSSIAARKVYCVLSDAQAMYVGTSEGVYVRHKKDKDWEKDSSELGRKVVFSLVSDEGYIYAATGSEIYRIDKSNLEVRKVYSFGQRYLDDETAATDDEAVLQKQIHDFVVAADSKKLFVASELKIFESSDHGKTWQELSTENLPVSFLHKLFVRGDDLYAATEKGIFQFSRNHWESDLAGLSNVYTNDVAADEQGNLYLASNDGVFVKSKLKTKTVTENNNFVFDFTNEPSIKDVQHMAVEYANVNPQQIKRWHKQSRAKALMPKLSMGLNRGDGEMYHWDTGPNPDVLTKGRDYLDWSTSLSWDFGDLVWSTDQTSIDSRSKLMSELRQDVLDQVTRLYFERRRIQVELAMNDDEPDVNLEKDMRVEELTALIDGLTGGEYSKYTLKNKEQ